MKWNRAEMKSKAPKWSQYACWGNNPCGLLLQILVCCQETNLAKIWFELGSASSILCYFTHIILPAKKLYVFSLSLSLSMWSCKMLYQAGFFPMKIIQQNSHSCINPRKDCFEMNFDFGGRKVTFAHWKNNIVLTKDWCTALTHAPPPPHTEMFYKELGKQGVCILQHITVQILEPTFGAHRITVVGFVL